MADTIDQPHTQYVRHSPVTNPGDQAAFLTDLPTDIRGLCRVVQGTVLHLDMGSLYGVLIPEDRLAEADIRAVAPLLARIRELADQPITVARPPERRLVGQCRVTAVLLCALMRQVGLPARARVGFAAYFGPFKGDHWVAQYWHAPEQRWIAVDAELDETLTRAVGGLPFAADDVPCDQFISAARAWQLCRSGHADPDDAGVSYVRSQLLRDLAAINCWEAAATDRWGLGASAAADLTRDDLALLDRVAALIELGDVALPQLHRLYTTDARLGPAPV